MMDACEPTSFNAALNDPEACIRNGGVTFEKFIAQLEKHWSVGSSHFAPPQMDARVGQTLLAVNRGGEVHTFTEVEAVCGGTQKPCGDRCINADEPCSAVGGCACRGSTP